MVGRRKQVDQSRENTFLLSTLQNPYPNPYTKLYLASPEQVAREWSQEQLADTTSRLGSRERAPRLGVRRGLVERRPIRRGVGTDTDRAERVSARWVTSAVARRSTC